MSKITLQGNPVNTIGDLPPVNSQAPNFSLTKSDLSEVGLEDYKGKNLILNIFPSIDTPTCATSVRVFNEKAAQKQNVSVLCVSADLPFALGRFCGAEGIKNVDAVSSFRSDFASQYKVSITDSPLKGLLSRAIVVISPEGEIIHTEQVSEIADEPNYETALAALK